MSILQAPLDGETGSIKRYCAEESWDRLRRREKTGGTFVKTWGEGWLPKFDPFVTWKKNYDGCNPSFGADFNYPYSFMRCSIPRKLSFDRTYAGKAFPKEGRHSAENVFRCSRHDLLPLHQYWATDDSGNYIARPLNLYCMEVAYGRRYPSFWPRDPSRQLGPVKDYWSSKVNGVGQKIPLRFGDTDCGRRYGRIDRPPSGENRCRQPFHAPTLNCGHGRCQSEIQAERWVIAEQAHRFRPPRDLRTHAEWRLGGLPGKCPWSKTDNSP